MKKLFISILILTLFVSCSKDSNTTLSKNNEVSNTNIVSNSEINEVVPIEFFGKQVYGEKELYALNYNNSYIDFDTLNVLLNVPIVDTTDNNIIKIGSKNNLNNYVMYNDYSNLPDIANMFIGLPAYKIIIEGSTSYYYSSNIEYEDFITKAEQYFLDNNFKKLSDSEKQELFNTNADFYTDKELFDKTQDNNYINNKENEIYELLGEEWKNGSGRYIQIINEGDDINGNPVIIVRFRG